MTTIRVGRSALSALAALAVGVFIAAPGFAQPAPAAPPPAAAKPAAAPGQTVVAPPDAKKPTDAPASAEPRVATDLALPAKGADPLATALAAQPGGLTPDEVAVQAVKTRRSIRAKQADLQAAQAKVDQALVGFFPRVSASATYTRLSEVPKVALGAGAPSVIVADPNSPIPAAGLLSTAPCAGDPTKTCVVDSKGKPAAIALSPGLSFPSYLNSYSLTASVAVPVSDYILRASQGLAAASHAVNAAKIVVQAETLQVAADARIAFFNWARAKGQEAVVAQSVTTAKVHVNDAKVAQAAGMVSRADVLRLEAQVAAAEQGLAEAQAFVALATEQLRIVTQAPEGQPLTLGFDILTPQAAGGPADPIETLQQQALQKRLEIRALDETQYSLKAVVSLARAAYFPRIDAFADVTYANPNQRIFPTQDTWNATWDAGIRASWTINDTFAALGAVSEAKARAASVAEQKAMLMEGLRLEVTSAYADLQKARASIEAAERGLEAADESLRVRQLLFRAGKATSTDLVDAEREETTAQFRKIDAHVGLLVAQTRLAHATGRDVKADMGGEP